MSSIDSIRGTRLTRQVIQSRHSLSADYGIAMERYTGAKFDGDRVFCRKACSIVTVAKQKGLVRRNQIDEVTPSNIETGGGGGRGNGSSISQQSVMSPVA